MSSDALVSASSASPIVPIVRSRSESVGDQVSDLESLQQRRLALIKVNAFSFLTATSTVSEEAVIILDGSAEKRSQRSFVLRDRAGSVRAALIPRALTEYDIALPVTGGFQRLGVSVEAINGKLSLFDREHGCHDFIGPAPEKLPCRKVCMEGVNSLRSASEWVEVQTPQGDQLTWSGAQRYGQNREGTFVFGWPGVLRGAHGDERVFIKIIKLQNGLGMIMDSEQHLRRAAERSPGVQAYAPLSRSHWTEHVTEVTGTGPLAPAGCAIILEPLVSGPTLDQLATGEATIDGQYVGQLHPRQLAECGRLVAQGLIDLNRNAPKGDRLFAPDGTKTDNLMVSGARRNAFGELVPCAIVCPDRDHYVSETNVKKGMAGTLYATDVRTGTHLIGTGNFDLVDKAHVFQVGRMLLDMALEGKRPFEEQGDNLFKNLDLDERLYKQALRIYDQQQELKPSNPGSTLGALIRECCDLDVSKRPSLGQVLERCHRISEMA